MCILANCLISRSRYHVQLYFGIFSLKTLECKLNARGGNFLWMSNISDKIVKNVVVMSLQKCNDRTITGRRRLSLTLQS